jgi:hypothetical protein
VQTLSTQLPCGWGQLPKLGAYFSHFSPEGLGSTDRASAYVIPVAPDDRLVPEGRLLVWEMRDAGASWTPHGDGLPQRRAWLSILPKAF